MNAANVTRLVEILKDSNKSGQVVSAKILRDDCKVPIPSDIPDRAKTAINDIHITFLNCNEIQIRFRDCFTWTDIKEIAPYQTFISNNDKG